MRRGNSTIYKHLEVRCNTPLARATGNGTLDRKEGKRNIRYVTPSGVRITFSKQSQNRR